MRIRIRIGDKLMTIGRLISWMSAIGLGIFIWWWVIVIAWAATN